MVAVVGGGGYGRNKRNAEHHLTSQGAGVDGRKGPKRRECGTPRVRDKHGWPEKSTWPPREMVLSAVVNGTWPQIAGFVTIMWETGGWVGVGGGAKLHLSTGRPKY